MKTHVFFKAGVAAVIFLFSTLASANNIIVSNGLLTGKDIAGDYILVQFDISWENSWRNDLPGAGQATPYNWDAAWVFIKFRVTGGEWRHAWLNNTGHTAPAGSTIETGLLDPGTAFDATTNPGLGAFIYRSANGTGTFSKTGIQLRWNYGANGVTDNAGLEIKLFAIEMVFVPQGSFVLGSGGSESAHFYKYPTLSNPFPVYSEASINVGATSGYLFYSVSGGDRVGPITASFPKGFNAFYCMKYEISQQAYVDFLNTLTRVQQDTRTGTSIPAGTTSVTNRYVMSNTSVTSYRSGIRCDANIDANLPVTFYCDKNGNGIGADNDDGQWLAGNWICWADLSAYLDWCGLRPMTELEFEKACRGTMPAIANEYAWGTATIASDPYTLSNSGAIDEEIATNYSLTAGNASYSTTDGSINGPLRVGIFAGNTGNSGRISSGATLYGIMEMDGNVEERPVTVGNPEGRSFSGIHGDGMPDINGNANASSWPGTDAVGAGYRGFSFYTASADWLRISHRGSATFLSPERNEWDGGRGVRNSNIGWYCGLPLVINHSQGSVAPVSKVVNYGTINNIPGETSKCWITQNLGADRQATAVNDATEASAGWYWQFNQMQGYKHDGTTRTPSTTWISSIDEDANWQSTNDPCSLEMGNSWRLPTYTEWYNIDDASGWATDADAWNSALKLHDAGLLDYSHGSLLNRGSVGNYWGSTQVSNLYGWHLAFLSFACEMNMNLKAYAMTVRCIKD